MRLGQQGKSEERFTSFDRFKDISHIRLTNNSSPLVHRRKILPPGGEERKQDHGQHLVSAFMCLLRNINQILPSDNIPTQPNDDCYRVSGHSEAAGRVLGMTCRAGNVTGCQCSSGTSRTKHLCSPCLHVVVLCIAFADSYQLPPEEVSGSEQGSISGTAELGLKLDIQCSSPPST